MLYHAFAKVSSLKRTQLPCIAALQNKDNFLLYYTLATVLLTEQMQLSCFAVVQCDQSNAICKAMVPQCSWALHVHTTL
jgi:hypothetical protein